MNPIITSLAQLAETQDGVVSVQQAYEYGATRVQLSRWIGCGWMVKVSRRSLSFPGQPRTWRQSLRAALNDCGSCSMISHRAAAALHRFDGFMEGPVELIVPRSQRDRETLGVVHSFVRVGLIDRCEVGAFPCTSAARTIIDLAGSCTKSELESAVDSAIRSGATSGQFLAQRLASLRHRGRPGVVNLDQVLVDVGGTNRLERRFLALCRRAGLPRPACQVIHRRGDQTVARVDFDFAPSSLVVEVEGQVAHASPRQRQRDAQRRRELTFLGRVVFSFTFEDVFERPEMVEREVRRELSRNRTVRTNQSGFVSNG